MTDLRELKHSTNTSEWYTPERYVNLVKKVIGEIELDPASSEEANQYVGAKRFFTIAENGLSKPWEARSVFLNAPGRTKIAYGGQAQWGEYLLEEYKAGRTKEAIQLIFNVSTETKWFNSLLMNYPICLVGHRIKFIPQEGLYKDTSKNQPTNASGFVYFGPNEGRFIKTFWEIGKVIPAIDATALLASLEADQHTTGTIPFRV